MANTRISDLTTDTDQIRDTDLMLISIKNSTDDNYTSAKILGEKIKSSIKNSIGEATISASGLMSSVDKTKLNGIEDNANNYSHPSYTEKALGLYKVSVDTTGHVSDAATVLKDDITALGIPAQDTTYDAATDTNLGLVKVGSNITNTSGTISLTGKNVTDALGYIPGSGGGNVTGPGTSVQNNVVVFTDTTGTKISDSTFTIAKSVPADAKFTDTTYSAATDSNLGIVRIGANINVDSGTISLTHDNVTAALGYTPSSGGISSVTTGDSNGTIKVTSNGTTTDVAVKGLGSNAYTSTTFAPLASPTFTGTPKAPTAAKNTNTTQIATTAFVVAEVNDKIATADAMIYKGSIAGVKSETYGGLTPAADRGHTYKVSAAGKINGKDVEVGDMLICNTDSTIAATTTNYETIAANWDIIQGNIDGAVSGPKSATDLRIAVFNGTTGKVIKDSQYTIKDLVDRIAALEAWKTQMQGTDIFVRE